MQRGVLRQVACCEASRNDELLRMLRFGGECPRDLNDGVVDCNAWLSCVYSVPAPFDPIAVSTAES
jgi:hypothetical protein